MIPTNHAMLSTAEFVKPHIQWPEFDFEEFVVHKLHKSLFGVKQEDPDS